MVSSIHKTAKANQAVLLRYKTSAWSGKKKCRYSPDTPLFTYLFIYLFVLNKYFFYNSQCMYSDTINQSIIK